MKAWEALIVVFVGLALAVLAWTVFHDWDPYGLVGFALLTFTIAVGFTWLLDV